VISWGTADSKGQARRPNRIGFVVFYIEERHMAAEKQTGANIHSEYKPIQDGKGQTKTRDIRSRVMSSVQARQGVVSGRVVTVLAVSVTLALLAMVFAFVFA
jgi:hypothetical protein